MRLCLCFTFLAWSSPQFNCCLSGLLPLRLPVRKSDNQRCPSPCSRSRWRRACSDTGPGGYGNNGRSAGPRRWRGWGQKRRPPFARVWGRRLKLRTKTMRRSLIPKQRRCCCRGRLPCWDEKCLVSSEADSPSQSRGDDHLWVRRSASEMPAEINSRNRNVKNTKLLIFYPLASDRRYKVTTAKTSLVYVNDTGLYTEIQRGIICIAAEMTWNPKTGARMNPAAQHVQRRSVTFIGAFWEHVFYNLRWTEVFPRVSLSL